MSISPSTRIASATPPQSLKSFSPFCWMSSAVGMVPWPAPERG
ncbi:MAG: hypothetical protein ACXWLM_01265 [Myxococcales bacterium]